MKLCAKAQKILDGSEKYSVRLERSAEREHLARRQVEARLSIAQGTRASAARALSRHMARCPLCST